MVSQNQRDNQRLDQRPILRALSKIIIPNALLFALYTQFHGDFGPGGGFQAGVIFAAALVLYGLVNGPDALKRVTPPWIVEFFLALGVLLYGAVGIYTLIGGKRFLDYAALDPHHPAHGQHLGILLVELGVGITVAAVMLTVYFFFTSRKEPAEEVGVQESSRASAAASAPSPNSEVATDVD